VLGTGGTPMKKQYGTYLQYQHTKHLFGKTLYKWHKGIVFQRNKNCG